MAGFSGSRVTTFPCRRCGACCRNVDLAEETRALDRGDGTCRHYSDEDKSCRIYDHRPDICRIDRQYQLNYARQYSWNEFVAINLAACDRLEAFGR